MQKRYIVFSIVSCILFFISACSFFANAQSDTNTPAPSQTVTPTPTTVSGSNSSSLQDLQNQINDLQSKISALQGQEKTLSNQIAAADDQIKLVEQKIEYTKEKIASLQHDISLSVKKISQLSGSVNDLTKVLLNRIVATYESGNVQPVQVLLSSSNVEDYMTKANYMKIVQKHDQDLLFNTEEAKNNYQNFKDIQEKQKQEVEALQTQLQQQNNDLAQAKAEKQALLNVTKNNEATYQQRLQTAIAEQAAITEIGNGGGNAAQVGPVNAGDTVGYVISGPSACSSGTHLHYEVHNNGGVVDPSGYLSNKSVTFENQPDGPLSFTGSWSWPVSDPIRIEQGYGMTYWARNGWYGGGPHTGIDMVSDSSLAVHAVRSGTLYRGGVACGGGTLLFAKVDQGDGTESYFLHIVP